MENKPLRSRVGMDYGIGKIMEQQLDQDAVRLAKAIRQHESGGNYNAQGKSGESGGYQFMPDTWKLYAKEILGDENAPMSPQNQNKIAYTKIKKWKDEGKNVGQIASMWNAGEQKPDAYRQNWKGVNEQGVAYDTPAYAEAIAKKYQQLKGNNNPQAPRQTFQQSIPQAIEQGQAEKPKDDILNNPITRGIMKFGNFMTGGGAGQLGGEIGSALAIDREKKKGLLGGQDNSQYVPKVNPKEALMGAGKTALGIASTIAGGKLAQTGVNLTKGLLKSPLKILKSPAVEEAILSSNLKGMTMKKFLSMAADEQAHLLQELSKKATKVDKKVIGQAIEKLMEQAVKARGGSVGNIVPGLIQGTKGGFLKGAGEALKYGLGGLGVNALYNKVFTGEK